MSLSAGDIGTEPVAVGNLSSRVLAAGWAGGSSRMYAIPSAADGRTASRT